MSQAVVPQTSMILRNVRVRNLQGVDLDLPLGQVIVITGVSGSGKTSLAFETLFAEGQRRYVESFSLAARQLLERFDRPLADRLEHIPPAVGLRALSTREIQSRDTLGSVTDLDPYLRLIFARHGEITCPACNGVVQPWPVAAIVDEIRKQSPGQRLMIGFRPPWQPPATKSASKAKATTTARKPPASQHAAMTQLWLELREQGYRRVFANDEVLDLSQAAPPLTISVSNWFVIVDRVTPITESDRLTDSIESAYHGGEGRLVVLSRSTSEPVWKTREYAREPICTQCGEIFPPLQPQLFEPRREDVSTTNPDSPAVWPTLVRHVRVGGATFPELVFRPLSELSDWIRLLDRGPVGDSIPPSQRPVEPTVLISPIQSRLTVAAELGLSHLPAYRLAAHLSTSELRRAELLPLLAGSLVNTLYVLDEPSAGLFNAEALKLLKVVARLKERGNTVVLVEHAPEVLQIADYHVELGPHGGTAGGRILYSGPPRHAAEIVPVKETNSSSQVPATDRGVLKVRGLTCRNFANVDADLPLGQLGVICGPPGTGKSALLLGGIAGKWPNDRRESNEMLDDLERLGVLDIPGTLTIDAKAVPELVLADAQPLKRSARGHVAAAIGVFEDIRRLFSETLDARARNLTPGYFSTQTARGGRCERCRGLGQIRVAMHFLPDREMTCPACHGHRYREEALSVLLKGSNVAEVLRLTVKDAVTFFRNEPRIQRRLTTLGMTGLGYLQLGQSLESLSGGERQRLKLASRLAGTSGGEALFLCDSPSIGLHPQDVIQLIDCLRQLVAVGHSVLVADNHPLFRSAADSLLELS